MDNTLETHVSVAGRMDAAPTSQESELALLGLTSQAQLKIRNDIIQLVQKLPDKSFETPNDQCLSEIKAEARLISDRNLMLNKEVEAFRQFFQHHDDVVQRLCKKIAERTNTTEGPLKSSSGGFVFRMQQIKEENDTELYWENVRRAVTDCRAGVLGPTSISLTLHLDFIWQQTTRAMGQIERLRPIRHDLQDQQARLDDRDVVQNSFEEHPYRDTFLPTVAGGLIEETSSASVG